MGTSDYTGDGRPTLEQQLSERDQRPAATQAASTTERSFTDKYGCALALAALFVLSGVCSALLLVTLILAFGGH